MSLYMYLLVPAVCALTVLFLGRYRPRLAGPITCAVLGAGLLSALFQLPVYRAIVLFAGRLNVSPVSVTASETLSFLMILSVYLTGFAAVFFACYDEPPTTRRRFYFALVLGVVAAMSGAAASEDLLALFVFTETVSLLTCLLASLDDTPRSAGAALKTYSFSIVGAAAAGAGSALAAYCAGGTSFSQLAAVGGGSLGMRIAAALVLCGYAVKAGIMPFHGDLPELYSTARGARSAVLACAGIRTAGIYAVLKIMLVLPAFVYAPAARALMLFGVFSLIAAAFLAFTKQDLKHLLTYAGISQAGYVLIAAGLGTPLAIAGAVFQLVSETAAETVLYLNSSILERQTGVHDIADMGGLRRRMPWTAGTTLVSALSMAGLPPLAGFWGQFVIIFSLWKTDHPLFAAGAAFGVLLTFVYTLSSYRKIFHGRVPIPLDNVTEPAGGFLVPTVLLSLLLVLAGLCFPYIFTQLLEPGAKVFI
ncbi:MAG: complex I subunit 5 family protein [Elusimicrobiaceae bacterium]|nr:complex I subunit 5 family protein [Elusimicrobiaceae bacterium]